jgi:protease I
MNERIDGKRIAFLATDGVEQVELTRPWRAVEDAGGKPELVSLRSGSIRGYEHLDEGDEFDVDLTVAKADAGDYDGLVLPGGVANPDALRMDEEAVSFVRAFFEQHEEVVVDEGLVTSRKPDDLDAFCAKAVEEFAEGRHAAQVA